MTANLTYNTLVDRIEDWIERNDLSLQTNIPTAIMLAQRRLDNNIRVLGQVKAVTGTFIPPQINSSQAVLAKPEDWKNTLDFSIATINSSGFYEIWNNLMLVSFDLLKIYWPDQTQTGIPKYYADDGYNHWIVAPTPNFAYPIRTTYMEQFPPIDIANQTNWLTENAPEVIFYATLLEAIIFTQNDQRKELINAEFEKAIKALDNTDRERITDRFGQRDKD